MISGPSWHHNSTGNSIFQRESWDKTWRIWPEIDIVEHPESSVTVPGCSQGLLVSVLARATLLTTLYNRNEQSRSSENLIYARRCVWFLSEIHVIIRPQNRYSRKSWERVGYRGFSEKRIGLRSSENEQREVGRKVLIFFFSEKSTNSYGFGSDMIENGEVQNLTVYKKHQ